MDKKISIIIPCYNVEMYVQQCMTSVVNQTYTNTEIIIVNDGSTDNTLTIVKEFQQKDARIIIVNQKNKGLSAARNKGIALATGAYITFVDSDDWLAVNYLEVLLKPMAQADLSICSYMKVFKYKTIPRVLQLNGMIHAQIIQRKLVGLIKEELHDPSAIDSLVTVWGKLYKSSQIKHKISFISTKLVGTEDLLFNLEYLNNIKMTFVTDESLYFYRKYNDLSLTSTYKKDLFEKWLVLFSKVEDQIQQKPNEFYEAYQNRICLSIIGLGLNELRNPEGTRAQLKNLKSYINHKRYLNAFSQLKFQYFPLHWKLFFKCAQYKFIIGLWCMLHGINYVISKNN